MSLRSVQPKKRGRQPIDLGTDDNPIHSSVLAPVFSGPPKGSKEASVTCQAVSLTMLQAFTNVLQVSLGIVHVSWSAQLLIQRT
jgi:hypothetical protein